MPRANTGWAGEISLDLDMVSAICPACHILLVEATSPVTIPAGCTSYQLSFWLHVDTAETTTTTQSDKLTVTLGTTTLATYSNLDKATGYVQKTVDVSSFAGQTVTLKFTGIENGSRQTSFVVDDTALTVG